MCQQAHQAIVPPAVLRTASHGVDGGHIGQPILFSASTPWRPWRNRAPLRLSRAGLRLSAGRQRRPRYGDRHRPEFLQRLHAGALGSAGTRVPHERAAADYAEDAAKRPHLCAQPQLGRSAKPVQRGPRGDCGQLRHADCSRHQSAGQRQLRSAARSLFSHFDQTAAWQAIASNYGGGEHVGWGGAVADAIESMNMNSNSMFTCISTAGIALFLAGQTSFQLNVTPAGPIPIYGLANPPFGGPASANPLAPFSPRTRPTSSRKSTAWSSTAPFRRRRCWPARCCRPARAEFPTRRNILIRKPRCSPITSLPCPCRPWPASSPATASLGVTRQIFYVQLGSFDTHNNQAIQHAQLLTQLGQALEYFDGLMVAAGWATR
jgi:hypothetical protein